MACRRSLPRASAGRSGRAAVIVACGRRGSQPALPGEALRDNPVRAPDRICYVRVVITVQRRDRIAAITVLIALLAGLIASTLGSYDSGIKWTIQDGRLIVEEVTHLSQAERDGIRPGMIATSLNYNTLIALPSYQYGEADPAKPDDPPPIIGTSPATPTLAVPDDGFFVSLMRQPIEAVTLISSDDLATGGPDRWAVRDFYYPGVQTFGWSQLALLPGLVILIAGLWWLRAGRGGPALGVLALPLAVAVSVPLLVAPMAAIGSFVAILLAAFLSIAAMLPLALGLAERVERPEDRRLVLVGIAGLSGAAALAAVGEAIDPQRGVETLAWALTGGIPLLPGIIAAGPLDLNTLRTRSGSGARGLLQSTELALGGATPMFALGTIPLGTTPPFPWWLIVWLLAIFVAARFTVRPLVRLATRATLQRDLIVAATEAERARLAADIHDDALQELTLLVRRLESAGDTEGAEMGRTVADRLRAICGDLRLPILDDLGVGPALDWLVLRIERLAGGEVRLERADDARHSPDVELAIFRVAQEALANAVKHGRPPIVVRYRSTPNGISLAIDDAGTGIPADAPETAERAGRFGLLNMAQRAEQIGAILDIKRWPGGGTHVALEWRPR
jgi:signal transduction histidine kinase